MFEQTTPVAIDLLDANPAVSNVNFNDKDTMMYYTMLCYAMLCYAIPYSTLLYSTLLYSTILYYTLLYNTILYYTLLYSTLLLLLLLLLLYSTLRYSTLLYSTLLYCTVPYCDEDLDEGQVGGFVRWQPPTDPFVVNQITVYTIYCVVIRLRSTVYTDLFVDD